MENGLNTKKNIIPFKQGGEFYLRRGSKRLQKNDLWEAVSNYHMAHTCDPNNVDYLLALAEVLTQMHRYEKSNDILFALLSRDDTPAECYFGLACNFIGLFCFDHALETLHNYLERDPNGFYAHDALDMIEAIEEEDFEAFSLDLPPDSEHEAMSVCDEAREMMERGDAKASVVLMEEAQEKYPNKPYVKNCLAMAYFCKRQYKKAIAKAQEVLSEHPHNIQALCNVVIFSRHKGNTPLTNDTLDKLRACKPDDGDDFNRVGVTFLEVEAYEDALAMFKRLLILFPYDEGTLHHMGVCYYQLKDYEKAADCYVRLLKIDKDDTIAQYYLSLCKKAIEGDISTEKWMNNYQVPFSEVLRRIHSLNDYANMNIEELTSLWDEDPKTRALFEWGLALPETVAKHVLLTLISHISSDSAEMVLRLFLLNSNQPDIMKREVLLMLRRRNAKQPYTALLDGRFVQSRAGMLCELPSDVPKSYQKVLHTLLETMGDVRPSECVERAAKCFEAYVVSLNHDYPKLTTAQCTALAAVIDYLSSRGKNGENLVSIEQILIDYSITKLRFNNAFNKLRVAIEGLHLNEK